MPNFTKTLQKLESEQKEIVFAEVKKLIKHKNKFEDELIKIVENCDQNESRAPLWAIVILGMRQSKKAIHALLDVFYTDADFWCEAAMDALKQISHQYTDEVFIAIKHWLEFILKELSDQEVDMEELEQRDQEYSGRVHVYGVLGYLAPRDDVKKFLLSLVERDEGMFDFLCGTLTHWPLEKEMVSFFRRWVEWTMATNGTKFNPAHVETKWALINTVKDLTGEKRPFPDVDKIEPWQERWGFVFDYGEEDEEETEKQDDIDISFDMPENKKEEKFLARHEELLKKAGQDRQTFESFELPEFKIEDYLAVRPRSALEQRFQKILDYLGLGTQYTTEQIQTRISRAKQPSEVLQPILDGYNFEDKTELEKFIELFTQLWSSTPRQEFNGLTPHEKSMLAELESDSDQTNTGQVNKVGRNQPCPCGSGKKYKKCCEG